MLILVAELTSNVEMHKEIIFPSKLKNLSEQIYVHLNEPSKIILNKILFQYIFAQQYNIIALSRMYLDRARQAL